MLSGSGTLSVYTITPVAESDKAFLDLWISRRKEFVDTEPAFGIVDPRVYFRNILVFDGWVPDSSVLSRLHFAEAVYALESASGQGVARNLALSTISSSAAPDDQIVYCWDVDDEPHWEEVAEAAWWVDENSLVVGSLVRDAGHKHPKTLFTPPLDPRAIMYERNPFIPGQALFTARQATSVGGFEPFLICSEDWLLWRRMLDAKEPLAYVPFSTPFVTYHWRANSQSKALRAPRAECFHLDFSKHGNAGAALDETAKRRAEEFEHWSSRFDSGWKGKFKALCNDVSIKVNLIDVEQV